MRSPDQPSCAPQSGLARHVSILTERQLADADTSEQIVRAIVAWREEPSRMLREALGSDAAAIDTDALADQATAGTRARSFGCFGN